MQMQRARSKCPGSFLAVLAVCLVTLGVILEQAKVMASYYVLHATYYVLRTTYYVLLPNITPYSLRTTYVCSILTTSYLSLITVRGGLPPSPKGSSQA